MCKGMFTVYIGCRYVASFSPQHAAVIRNIPDHVASYKTQDNARRRMHRMRPIRIHRTRCEVLTNVQRQQYFLLPQFSTLTCTRNNT